MSNLEELRRTWKQASSANNQELLAMLNCRDLDQRTQIIIAQNGNVNVLKNLFHQETLCEEARIYMAKRGNEEIHLQLLEGKITNTLQSILTEIGSNKVIKKLCQKLDSLYIEAEFNIIDKDEPETIKNLSLLKKISRFSCQKIATECSTSTILALIKQENAPEELLTQVAGRREEQEIHRCILEHPNVSNKVLIALANKVDTSILPIILNRDNISAELIEALSKRIDIQYFDKILEFPVLTSETLENIVIRGSSKHIDKVLSYRYLSEETQKQIIIHGDDNQIFSVMERDEFDEEAMLEVIKTQKAKFISVLLQGGNVPNCVQDKIAQLGNNKYNSELLKAKRLSNKAQKILVQKKPEEYVPVLLKREDLSDEVQKIIAEYALKKPIDIRDKDFKDDCMKELLSLKKVTPAVQLAIARSKNQEYIFLLLKRDRLNPDAMDAIWSINNPTFNSILVRQFHYDEL